MNFSLVIVNLKKLLNVTTDAELATLLNMSKSNFSERKKRGSLPYENILNTCLEKEISLDKIFTKNHNYKNEKEIEEVTKLLKYASKPYLDKIKIQLEKMKEVVEEG